MSELKRDTTIDVTIKEGKEFLESTRQKKSPVNENESDSESSNEDGDDVPTLERDTTMAATVKESKAILGEDDEYEKTRSGTASLKESITKSSQETSEPNGDTDKPKLPRDGTMKVTAKEAKDYLGEEDRERTRYPDTRVH